MIAYRAEIWCNGDGPTWVSSSACVAGYGLGTPHNALESLHRLAQNLEEIRLREGWTKDGDKHYCRDCSKKRKLSADPEAAQ